MVGSRIATHKPTEDQVLLIRSSVNSGATEMSQAKKYNVSHKAIRNVVNRVSWKHI